jgi:pimeloyl-ACP methyl ester carboxylesterase
MLNRREMLAASGTAGLRLPLALAGTVTFDLPLAWAFADEVDPTRIFTGNLKPTDYRLGPQRTLNDYIPFAPPKSKEAWETRRGQLREQLLVATGLWPLPEKTPLNPVVHGKIERDGYTIEKVFFASMPGHYVTGNLYRPVPQPGTTEAKPVRPAVLFAHGHWSNGRMHDAGEKAAEASVKAGGEPDTDRGRFFMQALPATLARLGFVVFQYDMIGYADSLAIPHATGFKDVEAELRGQNAMGLQTWNSIRALDFLLSLPDVDAKRVGMTGASGGGTQTFMLAAIDDRPASVFPAVMVSTGMQGGCVCENCSHLRVNTGNVEIAALFAPKPQAFSCANDWTKEFMTKGFPQLQELYGMYGEKDKVAARAWLEYGHQYNVHARQLMYSWFLKHLQGKSEEVKEPPFKPVPPKELSVFDEKHPRPKDELDAPKLREVLTRANDEQLAKLMPKDAASLKEFQRVVGTALRVMVNTELPKEAGEVGEPPHSVRLEEYKLERIVFGRTGEKDAVPCVALTGPGFNRDKGIIWLHPAGKSSLVEKGKIVEPVKTLLAAGFAVLAPDLLGTGENAFPKPYSVDKNFAGYTYGYNRSLPAHRVHDVFTLLGSLSVKKSVKAVYLVGWGEMGPVAILAKALAGDMIAKTAADLNQFSFEAIKDTAHPMMLPGAVKYGGMASFLALCAPGEVLVHNQKGTGTGNISRAAYEAAGAAHKLTRNADKLDDVKVVEWLVK